MRRFLIATGLAVTVVAAPGLAAPAHTTREGVAPLRRQIDARRVKAATVYSSRHVIHASLAGGKRYSVYFAPSQRRSLVSAMLTHHARFHIVKGRAHGHGPGRRYIALTTLAVAAALCGLTFLILRRRGRGSPPGPVAPSTE